MLVNEIANSCLALLKELIKTPSFSREEDKTALLISDYLDRRGIPYQKFGNNIISKNNSANNYSILLCSHHDTVKPNKGYTRDPFVPDIIDEKLFGLGSNDAGGALVSLLGCYEYLYSKELPFNLIFAAVAEEEISGKGGISLILEELGNIDLAFIGEPTLMKAAVAEKGLMVIDAKTKGIAGHVAHEGTVNPISLAANDINIIHSIRWEKVSKWLGRTKVSVSQINSGNAHNQIPAECSYVIDVRANECYSLQEIFDTLQLRVNAQLTARSMRLKPSHTPQDHQILDQLKKHAIELYGSPTLSDQALIPFPSVKMGPGDSKRSHIADEFIFVNEINEGIKTYIKIIESFNPFYA